MSRRHHLGHGRDGLRRSIHYAALAQGWQCEQLNGGHVRYTPPDLAKPAVVWSGTPGSRRSVNHCLAEMRRSGLVYPPQAQPAGMGSVTSTEETT